jgi:hypothetical protein
MQKKPLEQLSDLVQTVGGIDRVVKKSTGPQARLREASLALPLCLNDLGRVI